MRWVTDEDGTMTLRRSDRETLVAAKQSDGAAYVAFVSNYAGITYVNLSTAEWKNGLTREQAKARLEALLTPAEALVLAVSEEQP
jgi:hypothetical protein